MSVLNEPILLDSTGQKIASLLAQQNGYLSMIAEERRSDIYSSMKQIANIVRAGTVESNARVFPIGDQIIVPWVDTDDNNKEYQVAWDIVSHRMVELATGETVPGMQLHMHKCSAYGVQFSHSQAFMNCVDGLAAGTYYFSFFSGQTIQFTLTKDVPAGGYLSGPDNFATAESTEWKIKSWYLNRLVDPIEAVGVVVDGTEGTNLGTLSTSEEPSADGLNNEEMVLYGHNRWGTSALRQYLNSSGTGWYENMEKFDIRPDEYAKHGFMSGFSEDFLSAIKPIKVTTALNTSEGFEDASEDTYDTFFLPCLEEMNIKPEAPGVEGEVSPYWRARMGIAQPLNTAYDEEPNQSDALITLTLDSNTPEFVRLRSADRKSSCSTWFLDPYGRVNYAIASSAMRFSPDCVIC